MKSMIAVSLIGLSSAALADTTALDQDVCTTVCNGPEIFVNGLGSYAPLPNSAGWDIAYVDYAFQYRRLSISIGGKVYDSGLWNEQPVIVNEGNYVVVYTLNSLIYAADGSSLTVSNLELTNTTFCTRKCHVVTTLEGGTLTR
jgi:hypothetical protein